MLRTVFKITGFALLGVLVLAGLGMAWLHLKKPAQRPPVDVKVARTPERLQRGEYLAKHVVVCEECHAPHLEDRYGFPLVPGATLSGEVLLTEKDGFPGLVAAHNLTPDEETGLGRWSDGEILRAVREGVDREGKALFPMMPYEAYRSLSDEDAHAVVAYLRSLAPVKNQVPERKLPFPLPLVIKAAPKPLEGAVPEPNRSDPVAHGAYLASVAGCKMCHTPVDGKHRPIPGKEFAGGAEMTAPGGQRVITANITPHADTWVGKATKDEFIGRFRAFASINAETAPPAPKGRNTVMPWIAFSGMNDADLSALYDYLKTVPPVANQVEPFPDAPGAPAPTPATSASR